MNARDLKNPDTSVSPSPRPGDRFQRDLLALAPHLRAFSRTLCSGRDFADDLAQETLLKAWRARDTFEVGTNLKAWLFTILRNCFYSHGRRAWRQAHWDADAAERIEGPPNKQEWTIELSDTARALRTLPDMQREALILVGAGGFSYEEAAKICDTAIGTVKSRVARGRTALLSLLDGVQPLPPLSTEQRISASDDIFAQLTVIANSASSRAAVL
jgi:RNA polymerase sigma-70 factor (ECF subfamily)